MKKLSIIILSIAVFVSCETKRNSAANNSPKFAVKTPPTLTKLWETDTILKTPESVLYDAERDVLYVANIGNIPPTAKDNDGFISKLSVSGKIIKKNWITDLHAPKGMGRIGNTLYVTNIDEVVEIDIKNGMITNRYAVDSAKFLNDITISSDSTIYISDSGTNKIHSLKNEEIDLWLKSEKLGGPNGLLHQGNKMMLATFGIGNFNSINTLSKEITIVSGTIPGGDGVVGYGDDYIVSNWNGAVYFVTSSGEKTTLLDTQEEKINAADIEFIGDKNLLLVPTFFGNTVAAYQVK